MVQDGRFADLGNGIRLHYASTGDTAAPLLLFLHGFPEYWAAWEDVMPHFSAHYHAVAPDLRGFNLSSQPSEVAAYRLRAIVDDLERFVQHLGYQSAIVVAHDWGGAAAWQWAIAHPERIERLIVLNSPHPIPFARELKHSAQQRTASAYMNWLRAPGSETALARRDFAALDGFFLSMRREDAPWYTPQRAQRYKAVWQRGLSGGVNYYRASPLYPPTDDDPGPSTLYLDPAQFRVRVPTLVIWGEADTALPPALLDGLDELVDDLAVKRLPRATHWLAHEEPHTIAQFIGDFLLA